ncbi:MAG: RpiB/LacA/LacB family sugar-phosphate isomerase [Prevotellaceae bacterium]|jgi:ribose 5-phosphate isomerase B|nr:RpiB/LacA/LacB family sugar-phosphate isomerase [Prevotellaceae bacterium]
MGTEFESEKSIGLASDHAGYRLKAYLEARLTDWGYRVVDFGAYSDDSVDYPDFAHRLGNAIDGNELKMGVAVCSSGNGINIALNRHVNVRAAICWNEELAALAREHNDANVCTFPARYLDGEQAEKILKIFISTGFSEDDRHRRRINKINLL